MHNTNLRRKAIFWWKH